MSGWSKLGQALAGVSDGQRADIEIKTMNALAQRDAAVARARQEMMKARDQAGLGSAFANIGIENPEDMAVLERAGVNYNTLTGGIGNRQEQGFRQAAVTSALANDYGAANANLMGVASGPVEIPKVSGGMLLGNRLIPGGGAVSVTPVGQSTIDLNAQTGRAAIIRAERPLAGRTSSSKSAAGSKLTEIEKLRLKSALAPITAKKEMILEKMSQGGRAAEGAEAALKELEAAEQAVFDRFEGGGPALGERLVPEEPDDGVPVVEPGFASAETWYQDPRTGKQKVVPTQPASEAWRSRIQKVNGKPVVTVNSPVEAKAAWAKLQPGDGLKLPNGTIKWK